MSNNNQNDGVGAGAAMVIAGLAIVGALLFALAAFVALALTIFALVAWNNPVTVGGVTVTPEEARTFVFRGLAGAGLVPAFAVFAALLFGARIDPQAWFYLIVAGYVAGSLGVCVLEAMAEEEQAKAAASAQLVLPPAPPAKPKSPMDVDRLTRPPAEPAPFRFARWDDEEELRS